MKAIEKFYQRYRNNIENGIFVVLLAFYPLLEYNQGLDVADTSYSLANFQYFSSAEGTWMAATYLANVAGNFFMKLPKGDTLLGMYFYTGPIVSVISLLFYISLRKKMPAWIVFIGEMLAIGMCWCPTPILYNYLTYFLMGAGILLLYKGICIQEDKRFPYLFLAGVCLGANVTVRMPNVVQAAFILALWYGAWLKKETLNRIVKDTAICLIGYLAGFAVPFATICMKYGMNAYPAMVQDLFAMTDKAVDYKPLSMLKGMFDDYIKGIYWMVFALLCVVAFYIAYAVVNKIFCEKTYYKKIEWLYRLWCIAVCCVLIRFYWGQGMFDFHYYNYPSIYQWAVLFLLLTISCAVSLLFGRKYRAEDKVLALIVLLMMFVTPLGGNNKLYPIINNLFLAAPFTLWVCWCRFFTTRGKAIHFPWKVMTAVLCIMVLIQSVGFHFNFAFLDGVWGEKRDTLVSFPDKAAGVYTNRENAELLADLAEYATERQFTGREVILYGEIPGLSYFLDMPAAISTSWPDLDSYRLVRFEQDMEQVERNMEEGRPVVIVSSAIAAYMGEDAEAYEWFGVDTEAFDADEKLKILLQFLEDYGYEETFCNMRYAVYE